MDKRTSPMYNTFVRRLLIYIYRLCGRNRTLCMGDMMRPPEIKRVYSQYTIGIHQACHFSHLPFIIFLWSCCYSCWCSVFHQEIILFDHVECIADASRQFQQGRKNTGSNNTHQTTLYYLPPAKSLVSVTLAPVDVLYYFRLSICWRTIWLGFSFTILKFI